MAKSLATLCAASPGKYPNLVVSAMAGRTAGQKEFQALLTQAGVTLV